MDELETMARGFRALENIYKHSEQAGIPALTPGACRECMTAAAADLQGRPRAEIDGMFCAPMRQWRAELTAARRLAETVVGR
jgi:hypothetical protein